MVYLNEKKAVPKRVEWDTPFLGLRDGFLCFWGSLKDLEAALWSRTFKMLPGSPKKHRR
jgi:hypothetical protein